MAWCSGPKQTTAVCGPLMEQPMHPCTAFPMSSCNPQPQDKFLHLVPVIKRDVKLCVLFSLSLQC